MIYKRGFSLVEAIVSMFLIVVAAIVLLNIFPSGKQGLQLSENHFNAAYLGRSIIDDVRRKGFDDAVSYQNSFEIKGVSNDVPFMQSYSYRVDVTKVGDSRKHVSVEITWNEKSGSKKLNLETIITKI